MGNVIKLSIRALILEETLLKKGFFQAIFLKLLKVFGNREPLWPHKGRFFIPPFCKGG
jgi:hypothetical protein